MYPRVGGIENLEGMMLYTPILVSGTMVMVLLIFWMLGRQGYRWTELIPITIAVGVGGFGGAKLYSVIFHGGVRSLEQELSGGWRYPGSLIGMLAAVWLASRLLPRDLTPARYLDVWAPAFVIGCALNRIGCLLHGCCYGFISPALPWAIQYPYSSIPWYAHRASGDLAASGFLSAPVHPFPVYLMIMEVSLAAFLFWFRSKSRFDGQVALLFLVIHGFAKAALEYFRDPFSWLHVVVLPIGICSLVVLFVVERRTRADSLPRVARSNS